MAEDYRTELIDQALTLFAGRGYDAVSVQEIVDGVGVTKPTLYVITSYSIHYTKLYDFRDQYLLSFSINNVSDPGLQTLIQIMIDTLWLRCFAEM